MMSASTFHFRSEGLFQFNFILFGIILVFVGLILVVVSPWFSPIPFSLGGMILTGYRGISFDKSNQSYREFNSFLFLKFGPWKQSGPAEEIFINSGSSSQTIYTMVNTGTSIKHVEYRAYIKFTNEEKLYLKSNKDRDKLLSSLSELKEYLEVKIRDV